MDTLKIKGKLSKILEPESGTSKAGKEWKKQGFVIDSGDQYNPDAAFSIFGEEKIESNLNSVSIGDEVTVLFNVQSREFKGKWYTSLDCYKIVASGATQVASEPSPAVVQDDNDDLPF